MMYPRIDDLLENVSDSRYALVIAAAKRARQINNYHHQLGEGTFDDFPPPLVESRSKNYLTMALEEIARGQDHKSRSRSELPQGAEMARVLLGVTGGIAAYKACELCRLLVKAGHEVTPVLTPDAERFVTAHTFEALARREAPRDLYPHLVDADLLVIAPLSANTLAKLAHGLADNVLTQLALAFRGPAARRPGDERPHVGAPRHPGERGRSHRARDGAHRACRRASSPRASMARAA